MNKCDLVSVIIVNYNGKTLIKECLDALFKISYPKDKLEVIVVDNASNDGSVEYIESNYNAVKVIRSNENNYCRSCNIGITQAKGSYIVLLNNDVTVKEQWLSELVKAIELDASIGAVTSKLLREDGSIQNAGHYELPNFYWEERGAGKEASEYNSVAEIDSISGACVLYRKKALEEAGLLDEDFVMFGEDVDMSIRLKQKGWKLFFVPLSLAYHKFHGSCNERFSRDLIERNRLLLVAKHYPLKLSGALIGSGYFVTNKENSNSGRIFDLMPKILLKLTKHHGSEITNEVVKELFCELKRVVNYENKKLEDELKGIYYDLIETRKSRDHHRDNEGHYNSEISILSSRLKESLDSGLAKDNTISELEQQLNGCKNELSGIYNSEGFKYILSPLWKFIVYLRSIFNGQAVRNFIWSAVTIFIFPFILLQIIFFLFERVAEILFGGISVHFKKERTVIPFDKLTVSVVIPDFDGIELLRKCLASIFEGGDFKDANLEVLVIDDASSYSISESIKDEFPKVRVIRNRRNLGFGRTCNRGVREARGELVVLLNNDIMVSPGFLEPLKAHFRDDLVFAVTPKLYYWDKKTLNSGMNMGEFKDGYLNLWNEAETGNRENVSQASPTVFAVGGAMVFRKRDFLWLGGFDDIYRPNCWEDIDISYRAQKRGLKVLYEPKSIAYHKGAATLNYVRHKEIKNELLFMWKNLSDSRMLRSHFRRIPRFLYHGRHSSRIMFLAGYLWAFGYLILALAHRFGELRYLKISDREILESCTSYYRNFIRSNDGRFDK